MDPTHGIFGVNPKIGEMYTTVHVDNVASRTAFIRGGYHEVVTYADAQRDRSTTVLKKVAPRPPPGAMRVIGLQSGRPRPLLLSRLAHDLLEIFTYELDRFHVIL